MVDTPRPAARARPFGRYILQETIGQGGMGAVWKAYDPDLKRTVALKIVVPRDEGMGADPVGRFLLEARAAARLRHPGIVPVYECGEVDGRLFLTMELIEGETLRQRIERRALPVRRSLEIARDVARALDAAHRQGVVHRDIKPGNILIDADGRTRLADFGLARLSAGPAHSGERLTRSGEILGTPEYMSPEQARGDVDVGGASDQFSLGVVLYELLAGRLPFEGGALIDILNAVCGDEPPPLRPEGPLGRGAAAIVRKMMAKDAALRYPSLEAVADDIDRALRRETVIARLALGESWRLPRPVRMALLGVAGLGLMMFGAAVWALVTSERSGPTEPPEEPPVERSSVPDPPIDRPPEQGPTVDEILDRARAALDADGPADLEAALIELQALVERAGERVEVHDLIGRIRGRLGDFFGAAAAYRRAIEVAAGRRPRLALQLLRVAACHALLTGLHGEIDRAYDPAGVRGELQDLLAGLDPGLPIDPTERAVLEGTLAWLGQDSAAFGRIVGPFLESARDRPADAPLFWLVTFALGHDPERRRGYLAKALEADPDYLPARYHRVLEEMKGGRSTEALAGLDRLLDVHPRFVEGYIARSSVRGLFAGDPRGAIDDCDRAIAIGPPRRTMFNNRGVFRMELGHFAGAAADFEEAMRYSRDDPDLHFHRGVARSRLGQVAGASADLRRALELGPPGWHLRQRTLEEIEKLE